MRSYLASLVKESAIKLEITFARFNNTDDDPLIDLCMEVLELRQKTAETTEPDKLQKQVESSVSTVRRLRDQMLKVMFRYSLFKLCGQNLTILHFIAALYNDKVRMRVLYIHAITSELLRDKGFSEVDIASFLSLPIHKEFERDGDADKAATQSGFQYGIKRTKFTFNDTREDEEEEVLWGEREVEDEDGRSAAPNSEQLSDEMDSSRSSSPASTAAFREWGDDQENRESREDGESDDEQETPQPRKDGDINNTGIPRRTRLTTNDNDSPARHGGVDASARAVRHTVQRPVNEYNARGDAAESTSTTMTEENHTRPGIGEALREQLADGVSGIE